ncbi:MAG: amidase [Pseudonocardiales bacterium]|nr:MAG: amidase [Pseudonocardiales bacterium]
MTELAYLTATEALRLFRTRQLSPRELMTAVIERAELVEPVVNAFAERMFDLALDAAAAAERHYRPGGHPRPLEGLPVVAKEEQPIAGHLITDGTLLRAPYVATETAIVLTRIQHAGGIVHARTTTSEFCCMPLSHSRRWGVTRNPWNLAAAAGGSSGGSAASLAAGTTTLATGSDIGGSLRAPASFTGVVAFKPPHGRNPILPPAGQDAFFHHGPMARTVADCAVLQDVMAGPDSRDPASLRLTPPGPLGPADAEDLRGLRVAIADAPGDFPVDLEIRATTRATAEALRETGAHVDEVEVDWRLDEVKRALWAHFGSGLAAELLDADRQRPDTITPYTLAFARKAVENAPRMDAATGHRLARSVQHRLDAVLDRVDALVMPTLGATAFAAGEDYVDTALVVDGVELEHFSDASLTPLFNICSTHPVVAVPSGWAANGVPTGVQVVAAPYDDGTAFRVAAAVERLRGAGFSGDRVPVLPAG